MGIMRRLATLFAAERRNAASADPVYSLANGWPYSDRAISPRQAENLSTVFACVNAIASAVSSLPVYVYRRTPQGREIAENHPLMALVRQGANDYQTWPEFLETWIASTLLNGNGLAHMVTDNAGSIRQLVPIPWANTSLQMLPSGRLVYEVTRLTSLYGGNGRPRRLLPEEVMHLRDRSDDGLVGRSRLSRAAAAVSSALSVQQYAGSVYENGAYPSGVLEADGIMTGESLKTLKERFRDAFTGSHNGAKAMVLDQGLKWKSLDALSPEDAELLASRRFTTEELARIYQVPPPLVGIWDHSTFTNSETAGRWFAQHTLTPWIRKVEAVASRSLFSDAERATHDFEIDVSGFVRGDYEARWRAHEIAVKNQILTPNEVREVEGWNPRPGGEKPITPPTPSTRPNG